MSGGMSEGLFWCEVDYKTGRKKMSWTRGR